jgi:hypothetical protein
MKRPGARSGLRWLAAMAGAGMLAGCATGATTGAFVPVDRIEQELRRGVASKMDVQRVLGTPEGYGSPCSRRIAASWRSGITRTSR